MQSMSHSDAQHVLHTRLENNVCCILGMSGSDSTWRMPFDAQGDVDSMRNVSTYVLRLSRFGDHL